MKIRKPSPAMAVACTALFVALGGTSVAAVNFARNAGAVDGRSAVPSSASQSRAAGKLVATASKGPNKGRIPARFVEQVGSQATSFGSYTAVTDNQVGSPVAVGGFPDIGQLSATCADQNNKAGVEDPISTFSFNNTSGAAVNFSRQVGAQPGEVLSQQPGTVREFSIAGSNLFRVHIDLNRTELVFDGVVRQDGAQTADAKCLIYGTLSRVS